MKKIKIYTLMSLIIFSSCGENNNTSNDNIKTEEVVQSENQKTEKVWNEFIIGAVGNTMSEMKFDVTSISVEEDSWVRIILKNEGVDIAMQHNIVFIKYGTRKEIAMESIEAGPDMKYVPDNTNVIAASDLAMPGETVTLEFKAPEKGNYEYLCTYPGHSEIMRGYFMVK